MVAASKLLADVIGGVYLIEGCIVRGSDRIALINSDTVLPPVILEVEGVRHCFMSVDSLYIYYGETETLLDPKMLGLRLLEPFSTGVTIECTIASLGVLHVQYVGDAYPLLPTVIRFRDELFGRVGANFMRHFAVYESDCTFGFAYTDAEDS